ncbi:FMN-binding protein [Stratiformator vulcanicus]|uniref:FMN-binding domain protein n=1 Tax=Stratiformator vulcanicus TaxID=2527980 RepID=A0A517R223_9PLAN|nr:FMN-binding protein [Stratiformator vulcanicus]QDT37935.1 FMN-binding domain protein [Stratiformator vulcanicus]
MNASFGSTLSFRAILLTCGAALFGLASCSRPIDPEPVAVADPVTAQTDVIDLDEGSTPPSNASPAPNPYRQDVNRPSGTVAATITNPAPPTSSALPSNRTNPTPPVTTQLPSPPISSALPANSNPPTSDPAGDTVAALDNTPPATGGQNHGSDKSLDEQLAEFQLPPAWINSVRPNYDTSRPWKEARLEIRRLLANDDRQSVEQALKINWIYYKKKAAGAGVEYPEYVHLGGEHLWAVHAHEWLLKQNLPQPPIHAEIQLASLYTSFGDYQKAERLLGMTMRRIPSGPWLTYRQADVQQALGDLYAAWGKDRLAQQHYAEAARLYPLANKIPYGKHLLKRRSEKVQSKLRMLASSALSSASLRDGTYRHRTLGYSGDINVTVKVAGGQISDISLKHKEKIEQGSTKIVPDRIMKQQKLQVDGVTGATVTSDAIKTGVFEALKRAGL